MKFSSFSPSHRMRGQILQKGEVQVGEKEREHDLSSVRREIATLVAEKCVDPSTQRPYPVGVIDKAMTEAGFSVKPGKSAKAQVSECIKLLQAHSQLPIQRARMRVRVSVPAADVERVKEKVLGSAEAVEKDEQAGDEWETVRVLRLGSGVDGDADGSLAPEGHADRPGPIPHHQ